MALGKRPAAKVPSRPTSRRESPSVVVDRLLTRRLIFVAGKGGTGKTTLTAALALLAARRGKRVLCVDVDGKGDLARALGADPVGFEPRVVQRNISALSLIPEQSLQEYLRIYFKLPRFAAVTPLARIFDFIATSVPGARDILVVGKIAFEEKRRERDRRPVWDLILVDSAASGQVLPQLTSPRSLLGMLRGGGIMRSQVEWVQATMTDRRRTQLVICALPEEMPVAEAIELHDRIVEGEQVGLGACFLNRAFPLMVTDRHERAAAALVAPDGPLAAEAIPGGEPFLEGVRLARGLTERTKRRSQQLRSALTIPVVDVPYIGRRAAGLATSRAIADVVGGVQ